MKDSQKRSKKRPKLVESFNNVPNLLEKARQTVDEVTEQAPAPRAAAKPASRQQPKAAAPKKPAKDTGRPQKPARKATPPKKAAAASPAPETREEPLRGLADCGISVKHALPGRIRLRLRKLLYNEAWAAKLPALLAAVPGVTAAEASTATGSLLITFSSRDLAAAKGRRELAGVMHQFFPRLDTETLVQRMLRA